MTQNLDTAQQADPHGAVEEHLIGLAALYSFVITAVLRHRTFVLEWFLALEAIFCGVWIMLPGRTFTADSALADVPEPLTGALFLAHGLICAWVLAAENAPNYPRSQKNLDFCRRSALASAGFWTLILGSFVLTPPALVGFAVPLLLSFVFASLWIYLRLYLRYGP